MNGRAARVIVVAMTVVAGHIWAPAAAGATGKGSVAAAFLESLPPSGRAADTIHLRPLGGGSGALGARLARAEELWRQGRSDESLALIRTLETAAGGLELVLSGPVPPPLTKVYGTQLGPEDGLSTFSLDSDPVTGHLFAVAQYEDYVGGNLLDFCCAFLSVDGGRSWTHAASFVVTISSIADSNAVVMDGYLYVAFVAAEHTIVVNRLATTDGQLDYAYSSHDVLTTNGGNTFRDVTIASTADLETPAGNIFVLAIEADGTLRRAGAPADGDPWTELPTVVTNASHLT